MSRTSCVRSATHSVEPMAELVRLDIDDGIAFITLDSQRNRNALSRQLVAELSECLDDAEAAAARAIVLRHET